MNSERWQQIDELFLVALEHDDEERAAFLDEEEDQWLFSHGRRL